MNSLLEVLEDLKKDQISDLISQKMKEFSELGEKSSQDIFKELCFCFMTANFSAHGGIKIQNAIGDGFWILSEEDLAQKLFELGHRFPNARAKYVVGARHLKDSIKGILSEFDSDSDRRDWIVENIKGIGMKESSHFLRNIGYKNVAIVDFHIVDLLVKEGLIERPKTLTRKRYIEIEDLLKEISEKSGLSLGELDLYLWYHETGKVLK